MSHKRANSDSRYVQDQRVDVLAYILTPHNSLCGDIYFINSLLNSSLIYLMTGNCLKIWLRREHLIEKRSTQILIDQSQSASSGCKGAVLAIYKTLACQWHNRLKNKQKIWIKNKWLLIIHWLILVEILLTFTLTVPVPPHQTAKS